MYDTEPLLMFVYDSEPLVTIVATTKNVELLQGTMDIAWNATYSEECMGAIFLRFVVILQTNLYVQKSRLMKGSTSFPHKYDMCQNKHQTESKEIICFYTEPTCCYISQGWLVLDITTFIYFAALVVLHHTLHISRATGGLLFYFRITLENLGFITNYSAPKSSLISLQRLLFF
jgi:hypothetical protein